MKRFGIVGMGLFGFMAMHAFHEGEPDAAAPAASVAVDETGATGKKVPAATPQAPVVAPAAKDDAAVLEGAGFAVVENDPGLNYAMKFLAGNGFDAANPAVAAAFDGDFSLLKAELAQKGIAGWEQALGLAEQSYERHVKSNEAKAAEVGTIVTDLAAAQGVDWEQAVAHVASTASPAERTAINGLLADPATAHIAAQFITGAFINGGNTEIEPAARATGASVSATGLQGGGGQLSRKEYTAEMGKLRATLGDDYINSPQAQALYRRLG